MSTRVKLRNPDNVITLFVHVISILVYRKTKLVRKMVCKLLHSLLTEITL